jgi:cytochrome c oxidase subunit 2
MVNTFFSILATAGTPPPRTPGSILGMPEQASTVARDVDLVYDVVTWIMIVFFVKIVVIMLWLMFKYRRRTHVADTGGPTHHTPLEVTWTAIPLILVIAIFYVGLKGYVAATTPPENAYEIEVMGQRWYWTFSYPNGAKDTNVLHVPKDQPVKLTMRSTDVLHGFFVPAFRVKQDVVPGKRTMLWFEATRVSNDRDGVTGPGEDGFDLFCAEYCGTQHSQMVGKVMVYDEPHFEVVIEELARWLDRVPDDKLHLAGVLLYNQCSTCHTVDGSPLIGPSFKETHDLFRSGGQRTLTSGSVTVDEEYLRRSILEPLAETTYNDAAGAPYPNSMPVGIAAQLGPRGVEAMTRFIERLDEAAPGGTLATVTREELQETETP